MSRWKLLVVTAILGAVLAAGAQMAVSNGPTPLDLAIAKKIDGPYASKGQDPDPPDSNRQLKTRTVKEGKSTTFFLRLKNPGVSDDGVYITAETGGMGFKVKYALNGEKVTNDIASPECDQYILSGGEKIVFTMKVKPTGAEAGDKGIFGVSTVGPMCDDIEDRVFAKVKVTAP